MVVVDSASIQKIVELRIEFLGIPWMQTYSDTNGVDSGGGDFFTPGSQSASDAFPAKPGDNIQIPNFRDAPRSKVRNIGFPDQLYRANILVRFIGDIIPVPGSTIGIDVSTLLPVEKYCQQDIDCSGDFEHLFNGSQLPVGTAIETGLV